MAFLISSHYSYIDLNYCLQKACLLDLNSDIKHCNLLMCIDLELGAEPPMPGIASKTQQAFLIFVILFATVVPLSVAHSIKKMTY